MTRRRKVLEEMDKLINELFRKKFSGKVEDIYALNVLVYGFAFTESRKLNELITDAGHGEKEATIKCLKYLKDKGLVEYTEPLEPDTEVTLTEQGKKIVDRIREQERIGWESVSEFFE
ncbi:MAG: hypothetical protein DRN15_05090 [Thermoprotei archaeon]|nr:MAG: hypothetical protein DRN15_05090 [Thermoprotei archaeon]